MKIIFRDDNRIYYINENNFLYWDFIKSFDKNDLTNIKHLDDAEVLYHYKDITNNRIFPVYYEQNGRIITDSLLDYTGYTYSLHDYNGYTYINIPTNYTKDHTLINLKLLEDENII